MIEKIDGAVTVYQNGSGDVREAFAERLGSGVSHPIPPSPYSGVEMPQLTYPTPRVGATFG